MPTVQTLDYDSLPLEEWVIRTVETDYGPRTYRFYRTIFGTLSALYHPLTDTEEHLCPRAAEPAQLATT